ncbi:MAG: hypothetical protein ACOYOK_14125 [Pseudobdellovibrionaceae bacterium]
MKKQIVMLVLFTQVQLVFTSFSWAQIPPSQKVYSAPTQQIKRNVATVLFASIGGAILGLSTLSFYGKPEEHTSNITYGALLGCIGGLTYLAVEPRTNKTYSLWELQHDQQWVAKSHRLLSYSYEF